MSDIAIIGGGIIGLAIASRLVDRGADVTVFDGGDEGAWHVAAGMLAPGIPATGTEGEPSIAVRGGLSTVGVVLQGLVRFLFSVVVGNAFGKVVLGAANSAISLALFASLLQPQAAASAATKFVARARGRGDVALADAITAHLMRRTSLAAALLGLAAGAVAPPV